MNACLSHYGFSSSKHAQGSCRPVQSGHQGMNTFPMPFLADALIVPASSELATDMKASPMRSSECLREYCRAHTQKTWLN